MPPFTEAQLFAGKLIDKLMTVKSLDGVAESDLNTLCDYGREIFESEPMLLLLQPPLIIIGDIHGQFRDLLYMLKASKGPPPERRYLFLGDYVDRGHHGLEVITYLTALKILYPESIWLLRGNHEFASSNLLYGFYQECRRRYSIRLWKRYNQMFAFMPLAARISNKMLAVHGGISPKLESWSQISELRRPLEYDREGLLSTDLVWADPAPNKMKNCLNWIRNEDRGTSYYFGAQALQDLCNKLFIDMIVRGHEVVTRGHRVSESDWAQCVTIFSAPEYDDVGNCAGLLVLDRDLTYYFITLKHPPKQIGPIPAHETKTRYDRHHACKTSCA